MFSAPVKLCTFNFCPHRTNEVCNFGLIIYSNHEFCHASCNLRGGGGDQRENVKFSREYWKNSKLDLKIKLCRYWP